MKNLSFLRFIFVAVLLISGSSQALAHKMKVVTTFTIIQDIAQNVAGDAATVESITKPGVEIHEYQPTPKDIIKANEADLILWNGLNLELWFERFFEQVKDTPSVVVTEGVEALPITEGEYKDKPNPHAWMSVKNALIYIENIRKAFVKQDPSNEAIYNKNAAEYAAKIQAMDSELRQRIEQIPLEQRWLVTSEGAFTYLTKEYDMKELYLWPINGEEQISPKRLKDIIDIVRANNIAVVFSESTISDKPMLQVVRGTKAKYGGVLYVDSLSEPTGKVPTYIDLLKVTVGTILKGYNK